QRAVALANRNRAKPSEAVLAALADDLNTPAVITELHRLALNALSAGGAPADAAAELFGSLLLLRFDRAIGTRQSEGAGEDIIKAIQEVKAREQGLDPVSLDQRVAARTAARKAKNFAESDRIRDELAAMGVVLKDSKDGTTWEIAR